MTSNIETNARNYCDSNGIKVEYQRNPGEFPVRANLSQVVFVDWRTSKVQKVDASTVRWTVRLHMGERKDAKMIVYEDGRPFRMPTPFRVDLDKSVQKCGLMAVGAVAWQLILMAVGMFNGAASMASAM